MRDFHGEVLLFTITENHAWLLKSYFLILPAWRENSVAFDWIGLEDENPISPAAGRGGGGAHLERNR